MPPVNSCRKNNHPVPWRKKGMWMGRRWCRWPMMRCKPPSSFDSMNILGPESPWLGQQPLFLASNVLSPKTILCIEHILKWAIFEKKVLAKGLYVSGQRINDDQCFVVIATVADERNVQIEILRPHSYLTSSFILYIKHLYVSYDKLYVSYPAAYIYRCA